MGASSSTINNKQQAITDITQQFSGTCNVNCQNSMNDISIDIINTNLRGGINLSQSCSTDASCLSSSATDAASDALFTAANSTNAKNAASLFGGSILNFDSSKINNLQEIRNSLNSYTTEDCNISSYNQMDNISIFAANSTIGGDVAIQQNASTQGQCKLNNSMSAAAYSSGHAQNQATSGKDKKGQKFGSKFGNKSGKFRMLWYILLIIVGLVVLGIVAKMVSHKSK